ncbi:MAG: hypothetical protein QM790_00160 [Nibricoccus sp.]
MLTLFTLPRSFVAPFDRIQTNAFASWRRLEPKPELIFIGDDSGVRASASQFEAIHSPDLNCNHLGTPLVNHLFSSATKFTRTPFQGFVNADIILDPSLPPLVEDITRRLPNVLIVSRRWDLDVHEAIDFSQPKAFSELANRARSEGQLYSHHGMDLFVFRTGAFDDMPDFSIGWPGAKYDNWLVYSARRRRMAVVDITDAVTTIHQNHPTGSGTRPEKAEEHWISLDLLGGHGCCFDIRDATHVVTKDGEIRKNRRSKNTIQRALFRSAQRVRYQLRRRLLGFRYSRTHATIPTRLT